jgi:preprotein translocase subunit SecE
MEQVQAVERGNRVLGWVTGARDFLREAQAELKKVTWPTRKELVDATKRVIIMTLAIGVVLGLLDRALQWILVDAVAAVTR